MADYILRPMRYGIRVHYCMVTMNITSAFVLATPNGLRVVRRLVRVRQTGGGLVHAGTSDCATVFVSPSSSAVSMSESGELSVTAGGC